MHSHSIDTIYRKIALNANILPPEILLVVKDMHRRISDLEEKLNEKTGAKESSTSRRKPNKVSEGEVSSDSVQA